MNRQGPLRGVRVVELSGLGPAPFCAMVLADLGADVLRIDRPAAGRTGSTVAGDDVGPPDLSLEDSGTEALDEDRVGTPNGWDVLNRNRLGIAVDLGSSQGAEFVLELCRSADVFVEGFRPGVAERFGLGPTDVQAVNPRVVYGRMTGWGQDGPLAHTAGHDLNYLAVAGALAHIGREGQLPTPPLNLVGDFGGGGMMLAMGILAALVERSTNERGVGQVVDAAMVDGAALLMAPLFGAWSSGYWSAERGANLLDSGAPFYDCYECGDGRLVAVAAMEPKFYRALIDGLGLSSEDLPDQHDSAQWQILRSRFESVFRTRSSGEWLQIFDGTDACVTEVLDMGEAPSHPQAVDRGAFQLVGGVPQPSPAPRFDRTPTSECSPAMIGTSLRTALEGWGVGVELIEALSSTAVISES